MSAAVEKLSKTDDFCHFWPRLTDCAADYSAPREPIRLKFHVVDCLGYGYKLCEFHWGTSRYAGAVAEKLSKTDDFRHLHLHLGMQKKGEI